MDSAKLLDRIAWTGYLYQTEKKTECSQMEYYYLVGSLPMLDLDTTPPMSEEEFVAICADWLPKDLLARLGTLSLIPPKDIQKGESATDRWNVWETRLRNALAVRRARREGGGGDRAAEKFTRENPDFFSEIEDGVQEAFAKQSPLEREDLLDTLRWRELETLGAGHEFDFDKLCVYKLKLLLLAKRAARNTESGRENLTVALTPAALTLKD